MLNHLIKEIFKSNLKIYVDNSVLFDIMQPKIRIRLEHDLMLLRSKINPIAIYKITIFDTVSYKALYFYRRKIFQENKFQK